MQQPVDRLRSLRFSFDYENQLVRRCGVPNRLIYFKQRKYFNFVLKFNFEKYLCQPGRDSFMVKLTASEAI